MLMSRFLIDDALFSRAESLRAKTKEAKWQQARKKIQINKSHYENFVAGQKCLPILKF